MAVLEATFPLAFCPGSDFYGIGPPTEAMQAMAYAPTAAALLAHAIGCWNSTDATTLVDIFAVAQFFKCKAFTAQTRRHPLADSCLSDLDSWFQQ